MSVRAYRVNKIETQDDCSFNLWHDTELVDFLEKAGDGSLWNAMNEDGVGAIEVSVKALKKAIVEFKWGEEDYRLEAIKADVAFAENEGSEYVRYECY